MSKIKIFEINGKFIQYQFWCEGCGYEHAFHPSVHSFNQDFERPTLFPSLLQNSDPDRICHSWIRDGKIQYLNDCWHHLKGQTVDMTDIDKKLEERIKSQNP